MDEEQAVDEVLGGLPVVAHHHMGEADEVVQGHQARRHCVVQALEERNSRHLFQIVSIHSISILPINISQ